MTYGPRMIEKLHILGFFDSLISNATWVFSRTLTAAAETWLGGKAIGVRPTQLTDKKQ